MGAGVENAPDNMGCSAPSILQAKGKIAPGTGEVRDNYARNTFEVLHDIAVSDIIKDLGYIARRRICFVRYVFDLVRQSFEDAYHILEGPDDSFWYLLWRFFDERWRFAL